MSFSTAWRPLCWWMEIDGWYRSTLQRGCQQSVDTASANYRPGISWVSADCGQPIDRLAADYCLTHDSVDTRPTIACCWSSVVHVSVEVKTDMLITGRSRCQSLPSINTRSRVSLVMQVSLVMIPLNSYFAFLQNNRKNGGHKTCFLIISS